MRTTNEVRKRRMISRRRKGRTNKMRKRMKIRRRRKGSKK
jgi:hypothetical protein